MFRNFFNWIYIGFHTTLTRISIALFNTEMEILKANPNIVEEGGKIIQRKRHRNETIEKFYAGQRDEKYVQDYYEILKKADSFLIKSTPLQRAIAADKYSRTFFSRGKENATQDFKDVLKEIDPKKTKDVREYGFYDEKHKHYGKTMEEVVEEEYETRRTKDDDYELIYIFNNKPIERGIFNSFDLVEKTEKTNKIVSDKVIIENSISFYEDDGKEYVAEIPTKSKQYVFPMRVHREKEVINKIEELTEFLHIKKTAFEYRILEFFIPIKFGTNKITQEDDIFKEIIDIKEVYFDDEYGELHGFRIDGYRKRINVNNIYDVIKLNGIEMDVFTLK